MHFCRVNINKLVRFLLIIFLSGIFILTAHHTKADEFEVWTFAGAETELKKMELSFHNANFFAEQGGYFLNHTQISLDFISKSSVSLGVGYKQEYVKFPSYWRKEYRPMLHLYYTKVFGNFEFRDRSRWEFRIMDGELINRYRNQVRLVYTKFEKLVPYFSTEFSFYFNKLDYTRQRTIIGAVMPINTVKLNLFLGHQINEDLPNTWSSKVMVGTGLSYSF